MEDEIPIYEKLMPGEVLIISKTGLSTLYAVNLNGEVQLHTTSLD